MNLSVLTKLSILSIAINTSQQVHCEIDQTNPVETNIKGPTPRLEGADFRESAFDGIVAILKPESLQGSFTFLATGVLISPDQILTSAHAVERFHPEELIIYQPKRNFTLLSNICIHDQYIKGVPDKDLAILTLDEPLPFQNPPKHTKDIHILHGLTAIKSKELISFMIELKADERSFLPTSEETYLTHGHSGSPLFSGKKNQFPTLVGVFSSQEFSLDRSKQTRYFFATVVPEEFKTKFVPKRKSTSPSYNSLFPVRKAEILRVPISLRNIFDSQKHLFALTLINRNDESLCLSLQSKDIIVISVQKYVLTLPHRKSFYNDFQSTIQLNSSECLSLIFMLDEPSEGTPSHANFAVEK